jgi:hypothetical protein
MADQHFSSDSHTARNPSYPYAAVHEHTAGDEHIAGDANADRGTTNPYRESDEHAARHPNPSCFASYENTDSGAGDSYAGRRLRNAHADSSAPDANKAANLNGAADAHAAWRPPGHGNPAPDAHAGSR